MASVTPRDAPRPNWRWVLEPLFLAGPLVLTVIMVFFAIMYPLFGVLLLVAVIFLLLFAAALLFASSRRPTGKVF